MFTRAQEAISDLDGQLGQLRSVNHDLQKEMNDCRCRESDLLTLQSELSRTNALLRSDNCHLRNQVSESAPGSAGHIINILAYGY